MPSVRDQGELEPYLGRRAALHLHFARLRAEAWRGHTHAVGTLRQRAAGGAVVAGRKRGDQGVLRRQDLDRAAGERAVGLRRADHRQDLAGGRRRLDESHGGVQSTGERDEPHEEAHDRLQRRERPFPHDQPRSLGYPWAGCVSNNRRRRPPRAGRTNPQFLADPLTYERPASPARASISLSSGPQPSHEVPTHGGLTRPRRRLLRGSPATRATCSPASTASPT